MKRFATLHDAELAFRELQNTVDTLSTKNIDLRQRRIVNAHPSVDGNDYVVRRELEQEVRSISSSISSRVTDFYTIVFNSSGDISAGSKVAPPFIITRTGIALYGLAAVIDAPVGSSASFMLQLNDEDIFNTPIVILDGELISEHNTDLDLAQSTFAVDDVITLDVLSVGLTTPGSKASVELKVRVQ